MRSNEVVIADTTISRTHALLKIEPDGIYLTDVKSKFGTSILIRMPIQVKPNKTLRLQAGRTVMAFALEGSVCTCFEE